MLANTQCITLTDANFKSEVLEVQIPVLVDCWANWCGSFQQMNPVLEELMLEFAGLIKVGRLNVASSEILAASYGVRVVPTLLLFRHGRVMERVIGGISKQYLIHQLNPVLPAKSLSRI